MSVAGGAPKAVARANDLACDAFQIFVKSPNQWRNKPRSEEEAQSFRQARDASGMPVIAHSGYLINLASPKEEVLAKSRASLGDELERCHALGVPGLVLHPGSATGRTREEGLDAVARSLDAVFAEHPSVRTKVLLENTAGQGNTLGLSVDELDRIVQGVAEPDRLEICLDSCHAFVAGYDLRDAGGLDRLLDELDAGPGRARLSAWHLNDAQQGLGSFRDRHANIGEGELGRAFFARLVHDERFDDLPMILETPLGDDGEGHARDLATLRGL